MINEKDKQFYEILDLIDSGLATQNIPINQRALSASIEFLTKFVEQISEDGVIIDDFKSDFYDKKWFGSLYKQIEKWYCDKYGEAYNSYTKSTISGVVSIYNSPFKVIIPLTVDGKIEESGNKRWVTFPNSVLDNEDVIDWIENPPNLDKLNEDILHELYAKTSFVGESLRAIHINVKCLSVNNAYLSEGDDRRGHMQQGRIGVRSLLVADQDLSEAVEP